MKVKKIRVRLGQIWRQKKRPTDNTVEVVICGKKTDNRWLAKILGEKPNTFRGTHALSEFILWKSYELVS